MKKNYDSPEFELIDVLFDKICSEIDDVSNPEIPRDDELSELEILFHKNAKQSFAGCFAQ